jgi:hypothetical protein
VLTAGTRSEPAPTPPPVGAEQVNRARRLARDHGWWLAPPLVAAVLGGWLLTRAYGLWYDELYTAELVQVPLGDFLRSLVTGAGTIPYLADAPPSYNGPYYLVAKVWLAVTGLAPDETGLRLLSLVAAVAALAVFTRALGRLGGRRVALVAGLVAATNPFVVQYAAEARGYALALLATSLCALGLAGWLEGRPRSLLLYGLAAAAAGLMHWFALLVPLAFCVAAAVLAGRRAVPLAGVTAAASLPALSLVALALANGVGTSGAWWIADVGLRVPHLLLVSWSAGRDVLLAATAVAAGVGLVLARPAHSPARAVAGAWFAVPLVVVTAVELARPVYVDRYLLPTLLGLAALVAIGLTRLPRRAVPLALAAFLAVAVPVTAVEIRAGPKEDARGAVRALAARHQPGEPVVAAARWDALGLDHYARRDHPALVPDLVLPPASPPASPTVWVVRRARGGVKGDRDKLAALDRDLADRGLGVAEEWRFPGRHAAVLLQRWTAAGLAAAGAPAGDAVAADTSPSGPGQGPA